METTLRPAAVSFWARIPATSPAPTVTTSTFLFCAIVLVPFLGHQHGQTLRVAMEACVLHVVRCVVPVSAGISNQLPTNEILIAAIHGIAEHPLDGLVA